MDLEPVFDLEAMRRVDIRTVDISALTAIEDISVDMNLPFPERAARFLRQAGNAYCFRCGDVAVKLEFNQTGKSLAEYLEGIL